MQTNYQTNTTAKSATLPVTLQEAKEQLRIVSGDLDSNIQISLEAAVAYCERETGRSLRESHTIVQSYSQWPCSPVRFDRQPVRVISSITYYDSTGALQTLSTGNYRLLNSSDAAALLEFDDGFSVPSLDSRSDAVQITYLAGYGEVDGKPSVPADIKHAILLLIEKDWGNKTPVEQERMERSIRSKLSSVEWGCYR